MKIQARVDQKGKIYANIRLTNKELLDLVDDKVVIEDNKQICVNIVMKEDQYGKANKG